MSDDEQPGRRRRTRAERSAARRETHGWFRRHWILVTGVLVVVVGLAVASGVYALNLRGDLESIARVDSTGSLKEENRPDPAPGKSLNILVLGADADTDNNGNASTIKHDLVDGHWVDGRVHRSDTIMVAHVSADRKSVSVVSIPRDSWVPIYDQEGEVRGENKINAAFADYGPAGAISTVEHLTGLRMDHLVIMDWNGFKDMTEAVGGVRVYIPKTTYDSSQKVTWTKGWHTLKGKRALQYVRTRHGLAEGDFDRIKRQQNFIRLVMEKMMSPSNTRNPISLQRTVDSLASFVTLDDDFTTSDITGLAWSLRSMNVADVTFLTAPMADYEMIGGQSVVRLDTTKDAELWRLVRKDRVATYLERYPGTDLGKPDTVS